MNMLYQVVRKFFAVILSVLVISGPTEVRAIVLDFEGLTVIDCCDSVGAYGGLVWNSNFALVKGHALWPGSGYDNGTLGETAVFNSYETEQSIVYVTVGLFDFVGTYLTAAWSTDMSIDVIGKTAGITLYSSTVVVDNTAPVFFTFDYEGIDELLFTPYGGMDADEEDEGDGNYFVMDDFTLNFVSVPEPAGIALLLSGCIVLLGMRRRIQS
jgi:hypothetical protein